MDNMASEILFPSKLFDLPERLPNFLTIYFGKTGTGPPPGWSRNLGDTRKRQAALQADKGRSSWKSSLFRSRF